MIDFSLTNDQLLMKRSILDAVSKIKMESPFIEQWKQVAATGIIATCVDQRYGGSGLGAVDMLVLLEALSEGIQDSGLSFAIAAHTLSCVIPISEYGNDHLKEKLLPGLINGTMIAANAMTESESGSDVFTMHCKATKEGNKYRLNGTKTFISNASTSSIVLTYASSDAEKGFFGGLTSFIVEQGNYRLGSEFKKMGLDSCSLGEIIFDGCLVDESSVLGKVGGGGIIFNHSMEWERICLAGVHLGAMRRVLGKTINYVNERKSGGMGIGKYQGVSHQLAEMKLLLETATNTALKAAWSLDNKKDVSIEAAMCKLYVSNAVREFMLKAMQVFGGYGYVKDYGIESEVRNALAGTIYSGTSEIQKNVIASHLDI